MPRILVSVVCAYWIAGFVLRAAEIAGFGRAQPPEAWSVATLASIGCMVAATLFLWVAIAGLNGADGTAADIGGVAASMGIVTLALVPGAAGTPVGQLSPHLGVHIAALCCTYLVVKSAGGNNAAMPVEQGPRQARRMAIGAAHGSMLARLSGRGSGMAGSEA